MSVRARIRAIRHASHWLIPMKRNRKLAPSNAVDQGKRSARRNRSVKDRLASRRTNPRIAGQNVEQIASKSACQIGAQVDRMIDVMIGAQINAMIARNNPMPTAATSQSPRERPLVN